MTDQVFEIDWGNIANFLVVAQIVATAFIAILVAVMGRKFTRREEHAALGVEVKTLVQKIDLIEDRLTKGDMQFQFLDRAIQALPTREQLSDIKLAIEQVAGHARVVEEQGKAAREMFRVLDQKVTVIEAFLRDSGK